VQRLASHRPEKQGSDVERAAVILSVGGADWRVPASVGDVSSHSILVPVGIQQFPILLKVWKNTLKNANMVGVKFQSGEDSKHLTGTCSLYYVARNKKEKREETEKKGGRTAIHTSSRTFHMRQIPR
jgi:hypothetical protein